MSQKQTKARQTKKPAEAPVTPKKKINGRTKGARNERELAKVFTEWWGEQFVRTPLSGGWAKGKKSVSGDLVSKEDNTKFPFSLEAKCVEGWTFDVLWNPGSLIFKWWEQCLEDALNAGKIPLLVFKRNLKPWFAMTTDRYHAQLLPWFDYEGDHVTFYSQELACNVHIYPLKPWLDSFDVEELKDYLETSSL